MNAIDFAPEIYSMSRLGGSYGWHQTNSCCNGMQVDIVVVSCSCFAPTPSMAAMIVNHFRMREDVLTYSLAGMGCSSSLICVDMVKHLLRVQALPCKARQ